MYTGEKKPIFDKYYHARKFLRLPLNELEGDELKEEAYIQVIKQLKNNPDPKKLEMAWSLLGLLCSSYLPSTKSQRLYYSILNHLFYASKMDESNPDVLERCKYAYSRLYNISLVNRTEIPSKKEMMFVEKMKPLMLPIYLFSGDCIFIDFESYSTIKQVKESFMERLGFYPSRYNFYGLYEICTINNQSEERFLDESKLLSDVLSIWEQEEENIYPEEKGGKPDFKIYLRIKYFYKFSESDPDTISMMYNQIVHQFLKGRLNHEEKNVISLAGMKLFNDFYMNREEANDILDKELEKYLPFDLINVNHSSYWITKIMENYSSLKNFTNLEGQLNFIDISSKDSLWDSYQIIVTVNYFFYQ